MEGTVDGKNIVIIRCFKDYFALGFFKGALLKDPRKLLVQLGQVHAGRVMKFTNAKDVTAKAATIGSQAPATRHSRIDKATPAILAGKGFNER